MRFLKILFAVLLTLFIVYLLGPHPASPEYSLSLPVLPSSGSALDSFVKEQESKHKLKPDNEARIVWADTAHTPTEYAIVYLHGFSASQEEGNPVHRNIARQFGANLYLARLDAHGVDTTDALYSLTATGLWETAKQAYAIGKKIGKKVILMGTSTGGTLALQLAAAYPDIAGLVLYSPNVAIKDPNAWLLNDPWGLQIARIVKKSKYNIIQNKPPEYGKYWNQQYRLEAVVQLEELVETTMRSSTFEKIKQPVLTLYYYKDEQNQDPVVKVSAIKDMMASLGTPVEQERMVAIPNAGNHVLASPIQSKDILSVEKETALFLKEVMHIKPVLEQRQEE